MQRNLRRLGRISHTLKYAGSIIVHCDQRTRIGRTLQTNEPLLKVVYDSRFALNACFPPINRIQFGIHVATRSFGRTLPRARFAASDILTEGCFFPRLFCHHSGTLACNCHSSSLDYSPIYSFLVHKAKMENSGTRHLSNVGVIKAESAVAVAENEQSSEKSEDFTVTAANQKDIPVNQHSLSSCDLELDTKTAQETCMEVLHREKADRNDGFGLVEREDENKPRAQDCKDLQPLPGSANCNSNQQITEEFENEGTIGAVATELAKFEGDRADNKVNNDEDTFGLLTLFDEDLQRRDAFRWESQTKTTHTKKKKRKRKRKLNALTDDAEGDAATSVEKDNCSASSQAKKQPKRVVPNYFVAIRVSNPQIHSGMKMVQDSIITYNAQLKPACIPLGSLHLTLMVMHLEDVDQIQKARDVLNCCKENLDPILQEGQLTLRFSGLDNFRHQVLYSKVHGQESITALKEVASVVRETFTKEEIPSTDSREFEPHLTVMKLSRNPGLRRKGIKKIPEESYSSLVDTSFGEQPVSALHLCSMSQKDKDGFYKCVASVTFDTDNRKLPPSKLNDNGNPPPPNGNVLADTCYEGQNQNSVDTSSKESEETSLKPNETCTENLTTTPSDSISAAANQNIDISVAESCTSLSSDSWELMTWSNEDNVDYEVHAAQMVNKEDSKGNSQLLQKKKRCTVM